MSSSYGQSDIHVGGKGVRAFDSQPFREPAPKSIIDTLNDRGVYRTFISYSEEVELKDVLNGKGPLTVFAPRDYAFDRLVDSSKEILSNDKRSLESLLKYHILMGNFTADDLIAYGSLETIQGEKLDVSGNSNGTLTLAEDVLIGKFSGIRCTNGMIYPIDSLLSPEELKSQIKEEVVIGNRPPVPLHNPSYIAGNAPPGSNSPVQYQQLYDSQES